MKPILATPTSVYLYFDRHGFLIYVGVTKRGIRRNREHDASKDWWGHVTRQEVEHFPCREDALARERELIEQHLPPYNTQHNREHVLMRAAYESFLDVHAEAVDLPSLVKAANRRLILDHHRAPGVDHMAFRTRIADAPLAAILGMEPAPAAPVIHGMRTKRPMRLQRIENRGPLAILHTSRPTLHPVKDAFAFIKLDAKNQRLLVRQVQVFLDHSDRTWCDRRCPSRYDEVA